MDDEKRAQLKEKLERIKVLKQQNYMGTEMALKIIDSNEDTLNAASYIANIINERIPDLELPVTEETIACLHILNVYLSQLEPLLPIIQLKESERFDQLKKRHTFVLNLEFLLDNGEELGKVEFFTYCKTRQVKSTKDYMKEFANWYFEDLKNDEHIKILREQLPKVQSSPEYISLLNKILEFQRMDDGDFSEIYQNLLKKEREINKPKLFWDTIIKNVLNDHQDKDPRYQKQIIDMYLDKTLGDVISEMGNTDISLDFDERERVYHGDKELTIYHALLVYTQRSRDLALKFKQQSTFDYLRQLNEQKRTAYEFLEKVLVQEKNYVLGRIKHGDNFPGEILEAHAMVQNLNPFLSPKIKD